MYNIFWFGTLQAMGDSKHPLYYLIASSIVNVVLDILFIAVFHAGVGGAALATIISQFLSAFLCMFRLMKNKGCEKLYLRKIRFNWEMLKQIVRFGLPSGVQNSIIALANVVVQSNINSFGEMAMAGVGAFSKIEGFGLSADYQFHNGNDHLYQPESGLQNSMSAQNRAQGLEFS